MQEIDSPAGKRRTGNAGRRRIAALVAAGGVLVVGPAAVTAPLAAADEAAAPNGTAEVTATGMRFTGLDGQNIVTVGISANRFAITDIAPITAGAGCATMDPGGHKFGVFCQIPLTNSGNPRPFRVTLGAGDDTVTNTASVSMQADGGPGNDTLNGGPASDSLTDSRGTDVLHGNGGPDNLTTDLSNDTGAGDLLDGGPGDDDLRAGPTGDTLLGGTGVDALRGGLGPDSMDPGTDAGDAVVYLDNAHDNVFRVVVSLDGQPNDGTNVGGISEGDNVAAHTDEVFGSHSSDILLGNDGPNHLFGNGGDDFLIGEKGADELRGGPGDDTIAGGDLFAVPVRDGSIDILDGSIGDADHCRVDPLEADITLNCDVFDN